MTTNTTENIMTKQEIENQNKMISQVAEASNIITEANESEYLFPRWKETTEEQYWEMLGVLPPEIMLGGGFLVGEPCTHRVCRIKGYTLPTFDAYREHEGKFYCLKSDVTIPEFKFLITISV